MMDLREQAAFAGSTFSCSVLYINDVSLLTNPGRSISQLVNTKQTQTKTIHNKYYNEIIEEIQHTHKHTHIKQHQHVNQLAWLKSTTILFTMTIDMHRNPNSDKHTNQQTQSYRFKPLHQRHQTTIKPATKQTHNSKYKPSSQCKQHTNNHTKSYLYNSIH